MSDDDSFASRRRRRQQQPDSDEEEEETPSFASRGKQDSEEEEAPAPTRRFGRKDTTEDEDEEEDSTPVVVNGTHVSSSTPGTTFSKIPEAKRKKIQLQLIEGMFKYAESKYGRKRTQKVGEKQNAMEDYDLYLRSIKAKVKASADKLNTVLKQKKDIEAKVAAAEKEQQLQQNKYDKADEEKNNAVNEGRDPVLPKDFIVPQRAKKANAGLGALVMKASSDMWEDKFSAMRSKKTSSNTPDWLAKQKKTDKTHAILTVVKKKKEKEATPAFAKTLKKSDGGRRRKKDEEPPNPFKVNLKKTGLRQEDEEEKKPERKTFTKKEPSVESEPEAEPEHEPEPEPEAEPEPEPTPEPEEEDDMPVRRRRVRKVYDSDED